MLLINWTITLGLATAYVAGTVFGFALAFRYGRRQGLELSLDTLIALGYVRTGVNKDGETVIYKHWEKENSNEQS